MLWNKENRAMVFSFSFDTPGKLLFCEIFLTFWFLVNFSRVNRCNDFSVKISISDLLNVNKSDIKGTF